MKKILTIAGIVVAVLIVIAIVLPLVINVNRFKPTIETDLSTALARKVEIGNIDLSILSGAVKIDNVVIADDPAFSASPFLQAKQLTAGIAIFPLIFSQKLEVSSFKVTDPQVTLLRSASGKWNYSSLGAGASKPKDKNPSSPADFSVEKLTVSNGTISVGTHGKTQTYQNVNLEVSDLSYTSQFPIKFSAKTPGGGDVKIEGKAGPVNSTDASLTPLDATIDVQNMDLGATGFLEASSALAGVVDFHGALTSDGQQMNSKGTVKAVKIKLVAAGSPSKVPVTVDYDTTYDLKSQKGNLKQGDVHIGSALAHLTGAYETAGASATVQLKMAGQAMPVTDLEGMLPAAGVVLPPGASLQAGSLNVSLAISGPVDKPVIAGPINLSNAKLGGFNLKQKLGALASFAGLGGGGSSETEIQTLSADLRVDADGTHADNLTVVVPSMGTVTGNANVSPSNQLNCKMSAKLAGGVGNVTSALASLGSSKSKNGGGIPFTITGTTSNPIFLPDLGGMAGNVAKGAVTAPETAVKGIGSASGSAVGAIGGMFGKKKN